jgi:ferritin
MSETKITMTKDQLFKAMKLSEQAGENNTKTSKTPRLYSISDKIVKLIQDRLKDEYYAHYLYRAAANWCHDMNYKKAAAFFDADADTELVHAGILQKYLTDFNVIPEIPKAEITHKFNNLGDIINQAYEFELELMKSYNKISHTVFQEDLTTFDFLQQFRDIQKESVIEFNDLINGLNLVDKTDKFQVLYFEQTYF